MIVRFEGRIAFFLQSTDLPLDRALVDSLDVVVLVNVESQGLCKGHPAGDLCSTACSPSQLRDRGPAAMSRKIR